MTTYQLDSKRLNVINVNSEYWNEHKLSFLLRFVHYKDLLFKKYDSRSLDVQKTSILMSKFDILLFNGFHNVYVLFC